MSRSASVLFAFLLASPLAVWGQSQPAPQAPIDIPQGQRVVLALEGRGVQIYRCDHKGDATAWVLVAPEARLYDHGVKKGTHSAGPVWTLTEDGSTVHGKAVATMPSPDPTAIPWLLIKATEPTDTAETGLLTPVDYIRRTDTKGGLAASTGCDAGHLGEEARIPYTATYTFYAPSK